MTHDKRGRYVVVRKEYPTGQAFYVFERLSGAQIEPVEQLRIELRQGTSFDDVKRFEEWFNLNVETFVYGK